MNHVRCCMFIVIGLLSSRGAVAQSGFDPAPSTSQASPAQPATPEEVTQPKQASNGSDYVPVVPTLKVSASTSGKSDLKIGIDYLHVLSWRWDLHVVPSLRASTDGGTGQLFSFSNGKLSSGAPWTLGVTVAFSKLMGDPEVVSQREDESAAHRAAFRAAAAVCQNQCGAASVTDDEKAFCEAHRDQPVATSSNPDPGDLCIKGQQTFHASELVIEASMKDKLRDARLFPELDISV